MRNVLEIAVLIALPLAWGLLVEYVFDHLRRRRSARAARRSGSGT